MKHDKHKSEINIKEQIYFLTTKFMSNMLEAISKLKLKNRKKNQFSNLVLYLPAYSYTGI